MPRPVSKLHSVPSGLANALTALVITVVRSLSQNDAKALADYISRMPQSVDPHYGALY